MTNYLPYIFGATSLLGGLYLFLFSFRLYEPKHKTEEQKERHRNALQKFGTVMKVCSIVLILNGAYVIFQNEPDSYKIEVKNRWTQWTWEERTDFIENCMRTAGPAAKKHPEETRRYCECSVHEIMKVMTREQLKQNDSKPKAEQIKELLPIIQNCLDELKQATDSGYKQSIKNDGKKNGL